MLNKLVYSEKKNVFKSSQNNNNKKRKLAEPALND
jgi:hypothetical protein